MSLANGTRLGHYEIVEAIGAGGMGEVYKARDTRLDRMVAIKILPEDVAADPERLRRFAQEGRAASSISHSNVAHIYEIDQDASPPFIAMEFVEGERLDLRMGGRPLPPDQILDLAGQIADALESAHAKGVVHRDIKPANVIITPRGQVKVLDFGLAKVRRADEPPAAEAVTAAGSTPGLIVGTVKYMSPEQALGRPVDARSDLFSLGVVLYEMATGRLPFDALTLTETIDRIAHAQPDAVSRYNYAIPPDLERIIRKCLEKDPNRRYQSARELLVDVRNLKRDSDSGTTVAPASKVRRGWMIPAAALAGIGTLAAAAWIYRSMTQTTTYDSIAVLPFVNVTKDPSVEYLVDGLTESLINDLAKLPSLRVVPRGVAFRYKGKDVDPQVVARELNVTVVLTGRVVQRGDILNVQAELVDVAKLSQVWGDQYDRKLADLLDVQSQLTHAISAKLRPALSQTDRGRVGTRDTQDSEAYQLYLKGRYFWNRRTEDGFRRGMDNFNQAIGRDPAYASAYAGLADCYSLLARYGYEAPKDMYPRARAAAEKALAINETMAEAHASVAYVAYDYDWKWAEAEREFRRAIELSPTYATAHHWFGLALSALGRKDEAISELQEAQRLEPLSPIINANLARGFYFFRDFDRAIELGRKGLEIDPNFGEGRVRLGWALEAKGQFDAAIAEYRKAIDPGGVKTAFGSLGHAYALAGRRQEAMAVLSQLQAAAANRFVDRYDIALIYLGLGDLDQAFKNLDQAVDQRASLLAYLKVDPQFDRIRSDPRFLALLKRIGLS